MSETVVLDVREMTPRDRHPRIFKTIDGLAPGEAMLLVNDHDPRPLFYQLQAERPGQVAWQPQEEGPERWVIRIEKQGQQGEDNVVTLDVRPEIRAGKEPFGKIMDAVNSLKPGQSLAIINDFEPTPLYVVMGGRGYSHETERTAEGSWRVLFSPASSAE
jgi:uncharacterized protein (DUF2249 family)